MLVPPPCREVAPHHDALHLGERARGEDDALLHGPRVDHLRVACGGLLLVRTRQVTVAAEDRDRHERRADWVGGAVQVGADRLRRPCGLHRGQDLLYLGAVTVEPCTPAARGLSVELDRRNGPEVTARMQ
ncbi:hypothetical protein [Spirillospora sp. CA-128828]|uniref:hypothetical protein n=1 Tax=Spirillospora sp. CA-128828 TaxID=3240033 RepID=UPI003D905A54